MKQETPKNSMEAALVVLMPVREVKIGEEKIIIRELPWPKALQFLQMLSKQVGQFLNAKGQLSFDISKLGEIIFNASELLEFLILNSTNMQKSWLDGLTVGQVVELLDASLSVNLSQEILNSSKNVVGRFALAMGVKTAKPTDSTKSEPSSTS